MSIANLLTTAGTSLEKPWSDLSCSSLECQDMTCTSMNGGTPPVFITLGVVGNTPNVNGSTLVAGQLKLQPASALFGGILTTGAQSLAGNKTLQGDLSTTNLTLTDPGVIASQILKTNGSNKLVSGAVVLSSAEVSGILPIANGGTNSSTALTNGKVMVSAAGKIVEGPALPIAASIEFFDAFALMPGDNAATVALGAAVEFPQDGLSSGTLTRFNATQIKVKPGMYEVTWQVSVDEPGQLAVALAGVIQPNSVAGRATGTNQICGIYVFQTAGDEYVSIINPAGNPAALTITPTAGGASAVSAHMLIKKLV